MQFQSIAEHEVADVLRALGMRRESDRAYSVLLEDSALKDLPRRRSPLRTLARLEVPMPCMLTRVCQYHKRPMICAKTPVAAAAAVVFFYPNVFHKHNMQALAGTHACAKAAGLRGVGITSIEERRSPSVSWSLTPPATTSTSVTCMRALARRGEHSFDMHLSALVGAYCSDGAGPDDSRHGKRIVHAIAHLRRRGPRHTRQALHAPSSCNMHSTYNIETRHNSIGAARHAESPSANSAYKTTNDQELRSCSKCTHCSLL